MKTSDSVKNISAAIVSAQTEMTNVAKDATNPHFKNDYATLGAIIDLARPVLTKHGLGVVQGLGEWCENKVGVTTRIIHGASGEWMESTFYMPVSKMDPQGAGSAATYGRRYGLAAMLWVAQVDDDGEEGSKKDPPKREPAKEAPKKKIPPALIPIVEFAKTEGLDFNGLKHWISEALGDKNILGITTLTDLLPEQVTAVVNAIAEASAARE